MTREVSGADVPRVHLDLDAPAPPDAELRRRLAAAERLSTALFDASPLPIVLAGSDFQILRANAAFCRLEITALID